MSSEMTQVRQYCGFCYDLAAKAGREVRQTDVYEYPLCGLCEGRLRNGLIHYRPSNGTEFMMFEEGCGRCRHRIVEDGSQPPRLERPFVMCQWGVLDRVVYQWASEPDHICHWFDPADLEPTCPATCKRFTDKGDPDGERRDPPRPDCEGQLFLSEMLTVKERAVQKVEAR